jgi:hypothetical protein
MPPPWFGWGAVDVNGNAHGGRRGACHGVKLVRPLDVRGMPRSRFAAGRLRAQNVADVVHGDTQAGARARDALKFDGFTRKRPVDVGQPPRRRRVARSR